MRKDYLIWMLLSVGVFIVAIIFTGANITVFVYPEALIIVVFAPTFLTIAVYGLPAFGRSFRIAFRGVASSRKELNTGVKLFGTLQRFLLLTGLVTTMIGLIAMLANLVDESQIGPNLSLALITLFYSLMIVFTVASPFKSALENKLNEMTESENA